MEGFYLDITTDVLTILRKHDIQSRFYRCMCHNSTICCLLGASVVSLSHVTVTARGGSRTRGPTALRLAYKRVGRLATTPNPHPQKGWFIGE